LNPALLADATSTAPAHFPTYLQLSASNPKQGDQIGPFFSNLFFVSFEQYFENFGSSSNFWGALSPHQKVMY
jgi:hypothetical protein